MEWVETTGRTIDEAKDAALDQLGVDETDAEFEVLEEPRGGLFGRLRSEARVRARVRPTTPPPKLDRRDRRRRRRGDGAGDASGEPPEGRVAGAGRGGGRERGRGGRGNRGGRGARGPGGAAEGGVAEDERRPDAGTDAPAGVGSSTGGARGRRRSSTAEQVDSREGSDMSEAPDIEEQAAIVGDFIQGLVDAFGVDGAVQHRAGDDDEGYVEVTVEGEQLGLLIGPRAHTLEAIQELSRTVLQRHTVGTPNARVRIDVAGYRQRRREALGRFALQVAEEAKTAGVRKVLEPMNAADRKVIHDALNDVDGVSTTSEGEEPRRRVVVVPEEGEHGTDATEGSDASDPTDTSGPVDAGASDASAGSTEPSS